MKNDQVFQLFERRLKESIRMLQPVYREWKILLDMYHMKDYVNNVPSQYNFTSLLPDYADSIRARWIAGIFSGRDFFGLSPREPKDEEGARMMEANLRYKTENIMMLPMKIKKTMVSLSYLGTRFGATYWDLEQNSSNVKFLSNWDCFPDMSADSIEAGQFFITRDAKMTIRRLLQMQKLGLVQDVDKLIPYAGKATAAEDTDGGMITGEDMAAKARGVVSGAAQTNSDSDVGLSAGTYTESDLDKTITIYQMWTDEESILICREAQEIISVLGPKVSKDDKGGEIPEVNKDGTQKMIYPSPFAGRKKHRKPIFMYRSHPEEYFLIGLSPMRKIISRQRELNELRARRRKFIDLYIRGIWLAKRGQGIDWDKLKKEAIVFANNIGEETLKRLDIGGEVIAAFDNEEKSIIAYADRHTNIYDPQRGGGEGSVTKTVGGITLLIKEGNLLFSEQIANIQIDGITPMLEQLILLEQENMDEALMARITGKGVKINPEQLQGDFDIVITSAPGLGMLEGKQEALSFLQAKYIQDPNIKQRTMTKKELEAYEQDPSELMWDENEMNLVMENQDLKNQLAQLQAQLQQAGNTTAAGNMTARPQAPVNQAQTAQPVSEEMMV